MSGTSSNPPPLPGEITRRFKVVEAEVAAMTLERAEMRGSLAIIKWLLGVGVTVALLVLSGTSWIVLTTIRNEGRVEQLERQVELTARQVDRLRGRP